MSAEVIHLWGGEHEHKMRVPITENTEPATVIILPMITTRPAALRDRSRVITLDDLDDWR